ncbi:MAG: hypothetical protein AB7U99_07670 [Steroidobacteraceae bacterium]
MAMVRIAAVALLLVAAPVTLSYGNEVQSVGRGWKVLPISDSKDFKPTGAGGSQNGAQNIVAARNGAVPAGITALPRDIFTSDDFYVDQKLWTDPRYFRCNSSLALETQRGSDPHSPSMIGDTPPASGAWGYCDRDLPKQNIVSPYPFKSAKEHYEALLAETKRHGGPTKYSAENLPKWEGRYMRNTVLANYKRKGVPVAPLVADGDTSEPPQWYFQDLNQMPTILSLLTPEYQRRYVQQAYHAVQENSLPWPASFCWPEGFMRLFHYASHHYKDFMLMKDRVVIVTDFTAENFIRFINVGRSFKEDGDVPHLGPAVRQLYGETIGFWDKEALITWTSNIQHWYTHGSPEHSDNLQVIEIYTPRYNSRKQLVGLLHEAVLYDPDVFVEPVRIVEFEVRTGELASVDPSSYGRCSPTYLPVKGFPKPVAPGSTFEYEVPDMSGRPWAEGWEKYLEKNMKRPEEEKLFGF